MGLDRLKLVPYRRKAYDYAGFSCGNESMDTWLQHSAGQNERLNRSRTFLLVEDSLESRTIIGYFSLLNYQITPEETALLLGRTSRYSMPATLLSRLAVSNSAHGRGIGSYLLRRAMEYTVSALEFSASAVFIVDALDDDAAHFYQRHGLTLLRKDRHRLYVPTKELAAILDRDRP